MANRRVCAPLIWLTCLALLLSFHAIHAAEVDDSLSTMDTFDYLSPQEYEYEVEYETVVDVPETNKPTVVTPETTDDSGTTDEKDKTPEENPSTQETVVPPITLDQGNITVPIAETITDQIISTMPNDTVASMPPQPSIVVAPEVNEIPATTVLPQLATSGVYVGPRDIFMTAAAAAACTLLVIQ